MERVRPSLPDSYERLFHDVGVPRFLLLVDDPDIKTIRSTPRLERAIGVIYRPDTERISYYFKAHLSEQFDAVMHIDETRALEPLETWSIDEADLPEHIQPHSNPDRVNNEHGTTSISPMPATTVAGCTLVQPLPTSLALMATMIGVATKHLSRSVAGASTATIEG